MKVSEKQLVIPLQKNKIEVIINDLKSSKDCELDWKQ